MRFLVPRSKFYTCPKPGLHQAMRHLRCSSPKKCCVVLLFISLKGKKKRGKPRSLRVGADCLGSTGEPHVSARGVRGAAPRPTPGSPRPPGTAQPWVPGQTRQLLWDRASHRSASLRPFRGSGQGTGNSHSHWGVCTAARAPAHSWQRLAAWGKRQ